MEEQFFIWHFRVPILPICVLDFSRAGLPFSTSQFSATMCRPFFESLKSWKSQAAKIKKEKRWRWRPFVRRRCDDLRQIKRKLLRKPWLIRCIFLFLRTCLLICFVGYSWLFRIPYINIGVKWYMIFSTDGYYPLLTWDLVLFYNRCYYINMTMNIISYYYYFTFCSPPLNLLMFWIWMNNINDEPNEYRK